MAGLSAPCCHVNLKISASSIIPDRDQAFVVTVIPGIEDVSMIGSEMHFYPTRKRPGLPVSRDTRSSGQIGRVGGADPQTLPDRIPIGGLAVTDGFFPKRADIEKRLCAFREKRDSTRRDRDARYSGRGASEEFPAGELLRAGTIRGVGHLFSGFLEAA
jgi:hypothetical protein